MPRGVSRWWVEKTPLERLVFTVTGSKENSPETCVKVNNRLTVLTEIDRKVLELRFGLNADSRWHTRDEIGEQIGLSRERVRQIESRALRKLRSRFHVADSL